MRSSVPRRRLVEALAAEQGLTIVEPESLAIRRVRCGKGFAYRSGRGCVRNARVLARLRSLAVPPAYRDVRFAGDPSAHLQAVGIDAAGRLQYRYHPRWKEVREALKARRLARLARSLPSVRRAIAHALAGGGDDRSFASAAVVHLVCLTAIRSGGESYARAHGTRGAATLLKSNVAIDGGSVVLSFRAKGGKPVSKRVRDPRLRATIARLLVLPGRRLFQYRGSDGILHPVRSRDVNAFLRSAVGRRISLKDFRTLVASAHVLETLTAGAPAASERARRAQLRAAVAAAARELDNTPTVCLASYVHGAVVEAFESGKLARLRKPSRSAAGRTKVLARLVQSGRRAA